MNVKEKKKSMKRQRKRDRTVLLLTISILCIVFLGLALCRSLIAPKEYYQLESRVSNVALSQDSNTSDYQTVGWLKVQGTNLDLPILAGISDDINFPVKKEKYVWTVSNDDKFHNKMNIMGHNIYNLSSSPKIESEDFHRFEELMSFVYYDFAKENKYIQLTIDGKDYLYKIFSVDFINAVDIDMITGDDSLNEDIGYQIDLFKDNTLYDYDVDVNENDKIISLITCTRFFGTDKFVDFLVNGRLVREGEKIDDYSVKKNDNYTKVENVIKGDDSNESNSSM